MKSVFKKLNPVIYNYIVHTVLSNLSAASTVIEVINHTILIYTIYTYYMPLFHVHEVYENKQQQNCQTETNLNLTS